MLSSQGREIGTQDALKKESRGLSQVAACFSFFLCFLEFILSRDIFGTKRTLENIFKHH